MKIIIPQSNHGLIAEISGTDVNVIGTIDIPYLSVSKIVNDTTIVTLDKENKKLLFHTMEGEFIRSMSVPFGLTMNVKNSVVYVGGDAKRGEVCYMVDLDRDEWQLQNIELPVPMSWGKAVDDILILDDKMLLIDNIVYPKYTFEYDVSVPNAPQWIKTVKLPHDRAYENIIKGDMNDRWMVYLSTSSSGYTGDEAHITIEGKYSHTISSSKKNSILDVCLIGDALYTLTDIGLGVFDLDRPKVHTGDIKFITHKHVADRILKVDDTRLLLLSKYAYEIIDLEKDQEYFDGSIEDKLWHYGSLDLSNKDLERFPAEKIKNIENIEHLDLSGNSLKEFPEALRKAKNLRSLNLDFSGIKKIPEWIVEFEKLEYLNISTIDISCPIPFRDSRMKFPKNLKILNLRYCKLNAIPPDVYTLEKLEYLNILENNISKLPYEIGYLKNLKTLKLDWENVSKVSNAIKKLPIEEIKFRSDNGKIPKAIYLMTNLKRIEARGAGITTISKEITNLSKLEYLDLRDNYDLSKLSENIGELKRLKVLAVSVCDLKELPESICQLTQLEVLHLQSNKLTSLPKEIGNLTKLKTLDLSGNKLKFLPKKIGNLTSLTKLSLNCNKLEALPAEFSHLKGLKEVDAYDNKLKTLPESLFALTGVTSLVLFDNKLTELSSKIGNLKNLTELSLSNNKLTKLPETIGELENLEELDLSQNQLESLPKSLFSLGKLTELRLKDNKLRVLPDDIALLKNLKKLEIEGNLFTTLPARE